MLFQLVCTDRRYARMNCFNIRELQGILKRKFFVDLVDSHDYKELLKSSMINLRYKTNSNLNLDFDTSMFYKFGIHTTNINKEIIFYNNVSKNSISSREAFLVDYFNNNTLGHFSFLQNLVSYF